ncbi:MAG: SDR family NAD(P)-dependent oxidoreductase [Polyangiaceae bacterium]|nr:SDR family NAD(P)-dependent oxidoreductase [Polyangiaceae bacterium]
MERILILGATSAIAAEVAALHAARGDRLHLVGRSEAKLAALVERMPGASVTSTVADFALAHENEAVVAKCIDALGVVDRVLIAHGDLGDQLESEKSFAAAEQIIVANFTSAVSLLIPIANHLEQQGRGRIGVITSVAGDRGRPRNYTYGASKGALTLYLQGVRSRLYASGVSVTTLKLGPVDTPMTVSHHKNALFAKPEPVARSIVAAMDARTPEAYVPSFWAAIMPIVKNTPERLFQKLSFLSGR